MDFQQISPVQPAATVAGKKAMGPERYDDVYATSQWYTQDYRDMVYYPMWAQTIQAIRSLKDPAILEIGCGTGHLAEYLHDEGFDKYHGFDFSEQAIAMARRRVDQDFVVADAYDPASYAFDYNVAIALEVLEHLDDDIGVLRKLKGGTCVVLSLPTFDDPAHVRFFREPDDIVQRYQSVVDFTGIGFILRWFIAVGVIKG